MWCCAPARISRRTSCMRFCATQLPPFKAPKQILLRDHLPKSERGKLDRKALVAEWNRSRV